MVKLFDLVKVNVATTGTGTITFGTAFSNAFLTPSEAGCANGDSVRYVLIDGTDCEVGTGVIGGLVTTMTRTVVFSKIGGTKGTSKINLSGTAYLALTAISSDIGSVTSVGLTNSYGLTVTSSPVTTSGNINAEVGLSSASAVLGSDVSLSSTSTYFDGPSMAQGSTGKWFACGTITLQNISNSSSNINVRLWDGTTVMASAVVTTQSGNPNARVSVTLCGIITNPAGNIRISAKDTSDTTGVIKANQSGDAKDGTIYGFRLN
jgi:hypothetical protein